MKKFLLLLALLAPVPAFATNFYTSSTGDDTANNCQNIASPCDLTNGFANEMAQVTAANGDILNLCAGACDAAGSATITYGLNGYTLLDTVVSIPDGTSWANALIIQNYSGETITFQPLSGSEIFSFFQTNYLIIQGTGLIFDGINLTNPGATIITLGGGHHIRLKDFEVKDGMFGGVGIGNIIENTGHELINLNVHGNDRCPSPCNPVHGLYIQTATGTIANSAIVVDGGRWWDHHGWNGNSSGIECYTGGAGVIGGLTFKNLRVYDNDYGMGIYAAFCPDSLIFNSLFYDNTVLGIGLGCGDCTVLNSSFSGNHWYGLRIDAGTSGSVVRNVAAYGNGVAYGGPNIQDSGTGTTLSNNLDGTDPQFVSPGAGDFHLLATSPALGAGVAVAEVTVDFDGITRPNPPSIGAYEVPSGSDPLEAIAEDFESYSAATSISALNGGTGWTQSWILQYGAITVETAPAWMSGKALRQTATDVASAYRLFTARTGSFTISFTMSLSITNPDREAIVALIDASGADKVYIMFSTTNDLITNQNTVLVDGYNVNQAYVVDVDFDTVNQAGKFRARVDGGAWTDWENAIGCCAPYFTSIGGIRVYNLASDAHTFWVDDIASDAEPIIVGTEYISTTCTASDIQAKMNLATEEGDVVFLDCAGPITFTGFPPEVCAMEWIAPPNATLRGRGSTSILGGNDLTILVDDLTHNAGDRWLLCLTLPETGVFDYRGITVRGSGNAHAYNNNGSVTFGEAVPGSGAQFRLHHSTFDTLPNTALLFSGELYGVVDHNVFESSGGVSIKTWASLWGGGSNQFGDGAWAEATDLGTNKFIYIEDNEFISALNGSGQANSGVQDSYLGSRFVVRFNTMTNGPATQTHPTGGSGRARGSRAWEIYGNNFVALDEARNFNVFYLSSGTGVVWGNSAPLGFDNFITLHSSRRSSSPYGQSPPADGGGGWGYCGPSYATGTVTKSGTVLTHTGGTEFNTMWPTGSMILLNGITHEIISVESTTSLTVGSNSGSGALTYTVGSNIDQNTDALTGYPCVDAPGRGVGDRLSGFDPIINEDRGGAGFASANWNPRQALEPIYEWSNTFVSDVVGGDTTTISNDGNFTEGVDYYRQANGGVRTGTSLPSTCTSGQGFWKTNEGNWRTAVTSTGYTGQGRFYKCTATDTWTLYYTPYIYPHPLVDAPAGTATQLTFVTAPNTPISSGASLGVITVAVQDITGTLVGDATNTVTLTNCGGVYTLGGDTSNAAVNGVATFSDLTATYAPGAAGLTLCAASTGLDSDTSSAFTINGPTPPVIGGGGGTGTGVNIRIR